MRTMSVLLALVAALLLGGAPALWAEVEGESQEARDARMQWWREAKFGMFIHWGLYAVPGGVWKEKPVDTAGEWIMFGGQILPAEYEPLVKQFNPVRFNADEWVKIAQDAGMKYIVITSKHHDGFCLFDSKLTEYDVMSTPFKRDIMKELSEACQRAGIKMCWYHSILDWHHPD
ncbi:MAG: alpha-L-fucosidase, partial [Candidatus Hydrogenedentes bacterium]|nr:alpha-L-fucosidase [Candidatus Hydrogenedentota bacterium]